MSAQRRAAEKPRAASRTDSGLVGDAVALVGAMVVLAASTHGLLYYGATLQAGILGGMTAGLLAAGTRRAPFIAAGAAVLSAIAWRPYQWSAAGGASLALGMLGLAAVAALASVAAAYASRRWHRAGSLLAAIAIALVVANLWVTSLTLVSIDSPQGVSALDAVMISPEPGAPMNDNTFYRRVVYRMGQGEGYYPAFRGAYNDNARWQRDPDTVLSYRLPTVFWAIDGLPAKPLGLFVGFLVVATVAIAAAAWIAALGESGSASAPLWRLPAVSIPAAAALAAYLLYPASTATLFFAEYWSVPFALLSVAAMVRASRAASSRVWVVIAVVSAVAATLVRELMIFIPLVGLLGSFLAEKPLRRFRLLMWSTGFAGIAAAYAAHVVAIGDGVSRAKGLSVFASGGPAFLANALSWSSVYLGGAGVVALLAALGIVGAATSTCREERYILLAVCLLPLVGFLVVGNDATDDAGRALNYWAPIVVPLLIALSAWALDAGRLQTFWDGAGSTNRAGGAR